MIKQYYEAVFVYETNFQKNIIEHLIAHQYRKKKILVIDARYNKIQIYDEVWNINIGSRKNTLKSIINILKWKKNIITDELVGTLFAGFNSRFFEVVITYKRLTIIDDGIGTPVLLKNPERYWVDKKYRRIHIFNFIILLFRGKLLKTTKQIIKRISKYYTIYNLPFNNSFIIEKLDFWDTYNITINKGMVGVIGDDMLSVEKRNIMIKQAYDFFSIPVHYFPHPREQFINELDKTYIAEIVRPTTTIEDHFNKNRIPEIIVARYSTVLLNLSMMKINGVKLFYIPVKDGKVEKYYHELLDSVGVLPLKID
jgi:hypothetical protein